MTGTDAFGVGENVAIWRARISWAISIILVATMCFLVNRFWGIGSATAQSPTPRVAPASGNTNTNNGGVRPASAFAPFKSNGATQAAPVQQAAPTGQGAPRVGVPTVNVSGDNAKPMMNGQPGGGPELKVLAVVNFEQITRQDLARESLRRYGKDVLESMVNKHLILQACKTYNITITEKDVEDEITRIAGKFGLTTDRWLSLLSQERNVKPTEYRRDIIWPTLALRKLASNRIEVSQDELRKAFESEYGAKVKVRLIAVGSPKKAEQILAQAKANPNLFESLAKDHSEDPSASVMGIIPPIRRHLGDANLEQVAFNLKKGEISPIVKVANQYILLKCEDHLPEMLLSGDSLKRASEHLQDRIRDQKMRTVSTDIFKRLQDEAKVVVILGNKELEKQNPGIAATINGQAISISQAAEECILRHGPTVLDGEINRQILTQELKRRNKAVTEQDIAEEVARAADAYGCVKKDGTPDVDKWLQQVTENDGVTVELYVQDAVWPSAALKKLVGTNVQVTSEDIKKGFESNYGERVEVLAMVVANQRQAQQVWEQARNNPTDQFFGELASQYSVEPASKANFGKVPPIRRYGGQPVVEEHAFKLKVGELSPIIGVGDKFIIIRCIGRTKPVVDELTEDIRRELVRDIQEKKVRLAMTQEFDRLKDAAQIDNFLVPFSQAGRRASATPEGAVSGTVQKAPGMAASSPPRAGATVPPAGAAPRPANALR